MANFSTSYWTITLSKNTLLHRVNNSNRDDDDDDNNNNNTVFLILMPCSLVGSCQQLGRVYILEIYCPFHQDLRRPIAMKLSKHQWTLTVAFCTLWNLHSWQTISIVKIIKQRVSAVYNTLNVTSDFCMCNSVIFCIVYCVFYDIFHILLSFCTLTQLYYK